MVRWTFDPVPVDVLMSEPCVNAGGIKAVTRPGERPTKGAQRQNLIRSDYVSPDLCQTLMRWSFSLARVWIVR